MKVIGKTADFTEMQYLFKVLIRMEFQTTILKENGEMEWNVDRELKNGVMGLNLKVIIVTIRNMGKVSYS